MGYNLKAIRINASLVNTPNRVCTKCEIVKDVSHFYQGENRPISSRCKQCVSIHQKCKKFNIDFDEYLKMVESQNDSCFICKKKSNEVGVKGLVIDHDHKTGNVRGLLCGRCNSGLGMFKDSLTLLTNAVDYMNRSLKGK